VCQPQSLYNGWSDEELIRAAQKEDMEAFNELIVRYRDILFGYVLSATRNYHLALDVCQDTWLKVIRSLNKLPQNDFDFKPWLFRTATYTIKDNWKARRRPQHIPLDQIAKNGVDPVGPYTMTVSAEDLDLLPEDIRPLFVLRYIHASSMGEVSQILGITRAHAYRLHERGLRILEAILRRRYSQ